MEEPVDKVPKYGLKIPLNHVYPIQTKQSIVPRVNQLFDMMPMIFRLFKQNIRKKMNNKRPFIDGINLISAKRMHGCPIGGIGGGTIGRGFKGEFCRFQLYPGIYEYITVPECQFIVNIRNDKKETIFQSVLSTYDKPKKAPQSWQWNLNAAECEYTGLYPRAWTTYDLSKYGVTLVCRQISPVIPHNYKDSSLPCAVFVFSVKNVSNEHRDVSISFTWTEVLGNHSKESIEKLELERYSEEQTCGVTLKQEVSDIPCTFTIAKKKQDEPVDEGYCLWSTAKSSNYVWKCIKEHGKLIPDPSVTPVVRDDEGNAENENKEKPKNTCDSIGLSSTFSLDPGGSESTEFCLTWDMPVIKYEKETKVHKRYYTKYFGSDSKAGPKIAAYALQNYGNWEKQIAEWQDPILNNSNIPDWLKGALMNELYFIADGGSIWFDVQDEYPISDPRHEFGVFGYLEGHEYRMYNTYDVHFYASFALAQLWPNLQMVIQYMFRETIELETDKSRQSLYDGKTTKYKVKGSIPHDLGDPEDLPFSHINAYCMHDVSEWRDLNLKFILQVMRDYRLLSDSSFGNSYRSSASDAEKPSAPLWDNKTYLADMYSSCAALLRRSALWDTDGDGLIENSGTPDQTYDTWYMTGPSAYCGGLWLAAVSGVRSMARILGREEDEREFAKLLEQASGSYEHKLWNGSFYSFDTRPANKHVVMADQLAGQWFLRASGSTDQVFPEANVKKALQTIYENNVLKFAGGHMGAVNGYVTGERARVDTTTMQSEEMWTGVTFGLAALMTYEGMHKEAFVTAGEMYKTLTNMGLSFETPEALFENGSHRSISYMRPLAVWAMYQAIMDTPLPQDNERQATDKSL